ncbi:hypothetical protein HID58_073647, partial [Brassica napus]
YDPGRLNKPWVTEFHLGSSEIHSMLGAEYHVSLGFHSNTNNYEKCSFESKEDPNARATTVS